MLNDKLDKILRTKLDNLESMPSSDLWSKIEMQLPTESPASTWTKGKILGIALSACLSGVGVWFASQSTTSHTLHSTNQPTAATSYVPIAIKKDISEEKTQEIIAQNTTASKANVLLSRNRIQNPIVCQETIEVNQNNLPEASLNTPAIQAKPIDIDIHKAPGSKTVKTYKAGETITLQFEFQNISGFNSKKVESWIEFPSWVDITSVKTLDYSKGIQVKTSKKAKLNTVIWLAEGDFAADLNAIKSKGMIEYSFKINEDKTESEINQIKPEIK